MSTPVTLYTWPDGDTIAVKQGATDPGYPDELTVLGPVYVPRVYGKDLTALELGSSGKVVVTLDDLKTMELSNIYSNNMLSSTVIKGVASNAITIDPSDAANTVVAGNLTMNDSNNYLALSTSNVNGIAIRNALAVTGAAFLQSNLAVASNATIAGNTAIDGNLSVLGSTSFAGGVDLTGDVTVTGKLTASNDLEVIGQAFLRSNLTVDGPVTLSNAVTMGSNLSVASNASIGSNLTVSGSATITSGATISSGLTASGTIALTGPTTITGTTDIIGTTSVTGPLSVSGITTLGSNLDVASNLTVQGATALQSLSATSASVTGPATVTGATTLQDSLSVSGATSLASTLAVTGAATFASNVSLAAGRILDVDNIKSVGNTLLLDAAEVVLTGDLNIAGSLNAVNRTVLNVEDKRVTLASASNGLVDGTLTNDGAGVQVFGLPANVDPAESANPVYEKSLAWRYGTSGVTALRSNAQTESYWDIRGGHLRLTSYKTSDTAVAYGFRINGTDELELVRYTTDGNSVTSKRIARFGGGVAFGALILPSLFNLRNVPSDGSPGFAMQYNLDDSALRLNSTGNLIVLEFTAQNGAGVFGALDGFYRLAHLATSEAIYVVPFSLDVSFGSYASANDDPAYSFKIIRHSSSTYYIQAAVTTAQGYTGPGAGTPHFLTWDSATDAVKISPTPFAWDIDALP
jgi:hypothetical protein